jgi:UDP:flavonoid glycosyltransferase YjiC (YdhE family)
VRVLFATTAGAGHYGPLVPFARACVAAGHDVVVAAPGSFAESVARDGFEHAEFADVPPERMGPVYGRLSELSFEEANRTVLAVIFGRLDAQAALPGVREVIADWRPDIVVREPCEFGSLVAAERAGLPQVQVAIGLGALGGFALPILEEPLAELSVLAGLPDARASELLLTTAGFTCVPAPLDGVDGHVTGTPPVPGAGPVWRFRDAALAAGTGRLPLDGRWGDPEHPLVYVSFGSVTAGAEKFARIYPATLEVLAGMPIRVLMTLGPAGDPDSLGTLPPNTHIERWWPQADVMPQAEAMVGHGGFGTTMMALATGVPQVVVPLFAFDQATNAERVDAVGAGIAVAGGPAAAEEIAGGVSRLLAEPAYAEGARAVASRDWPAGRSS